MNERDVMRRLVLVADDDDDGRAALVAALRMAHWDVIEAADGARALELAIEQTPTLAILDLRMPSMDGATLAQRLREHAPTQRIPIFLVTGAGSSKEIAAASAICDSVLFKPIDLAQVVAAAERALEERKPWQLRLATFAADDPFVAAFAEAADRAGATPDQALDGALSILIVLATELGVGIDDLRAELAELGRE